MPQRFWVCSVESVSATKLREPRGENLKILPDQDQVMPHSTLVHGSGLRQRVYAHRQVDPLLPRGPEVDESHIDGLLGLFYRYLELLNCVGVLLQEKNKRVLSDKCGASRTIQCRPEQLTG